MKKITIDGRRRLQGEISVSGSKNAVLPIIFACILTNGISEIRNTPDIGDVSVALEILSSLGAKIHTRENVTLIDTRNLGYNTPSAESVSKIRASTYLIGSCLSRFGICHILPFGGCDFATRPIDMHLSACRDFGGRVEGNLITADGLFGNKISLRLPSVGATVNAILLAASAKGDSLIEGCATEPHIDSLIEFINSCGGMVERHGDKIFVSGRELHGGSIDIFGDMIEAGSYIAAGIVTESEIAIKNCPTDQMSSVLSAFSDMGARFDIDGSTIHTRFGGAFRHLQIRAEPYPGFPTDLQPIMSAVMACTMGGEIYDFVWKNRFGYLDKLALFGVKYMRNNDSALIFPSNIHSASVIAPDLRGGMACVLCALSAEGRSEIDSVNIILRGYEKLTEKLSRLGAQIKVVN